MPAQSNRSLRRRALVLALAAAFPFGAVANPLDPTVVSGNAAFESNGSTLAITNSNGAIIHWQSFSIGNGETTRFIQPSVDSQVLNRVMGQDPSTILGTLQSNGQVFLINPNGIAFGAHAVVDVAGLVASTLNLSNADFLAGRYSFAGNGAPGGIRNDGLLQALAGGRILLVAPDIANHGVITVPGGDVILAAGHSVQMIDTHRPDVQVQVTAANDSAVNLGRITSGHIGIYGAAIRQEGTVSATTAAVGENGTVVFRAASTLQAGANSITEARGQNGGSIDVAAPVAWLDGTIRADGDAGGQVRVAADAIVQSGTISARGLAGDGGSIDLGTSGNLLQTATARLLASGAAQGGDIRVVSTDGQVYSSAGFDASSGNGIGGRIAVGGDRVVIAGASLDASGALGGGSVLVGGGFRGADPTLANSTYTRVTTGSVLRADATSNGAGGTVAIWSDGDTRYQGAASVRGAGTAQPGGIVEVSGKDSLRYGGTVELSPGAGGAPGSLLLDPKTIIIDNVGGATGYVIVADFDDPNPTAGAQFGSYWTTSFFGNGNVLVRVPDADIGALDAAGAIYLFSSTGVLQATATGAASNDRVGDGSIYVLNNGNFLLLNGSWAGGRGAVTLGNPTTLLGSPSSVISSANSLVGSSTSDRIGDLFPFFMSNGNYVLLSDAWNGNRGAYTFGTPTSLATGVVSSANSLVGTTPDDFSSRIFRELSGVNMYAIFARGYDNGGVVDAGAITFGNKSTGLTGTVNASNSLIGAAAGDQFGFSEFELDSLGGTRYLFANSRWNGGRGIVTWLDLASALPGVLSSSNSLVGSAAGDNIGSDFRVLSDKYIVIAPNWNNGRGAVAMGDVNTGLTGVVTSSNSLIGATDGDRIGDVVVLLNNGHYVVGSPEATINGIAAAGAVVWGDGVNGTVGVVDDTNSLHGSHAGDRVGNVISALDNGNYVVESPDWNGTAGAVTFVQGGDGHFRVGGGLVTAGIVSADNSVVGSVAGSRVGSGGILPVVFEDAYLVLSPLWTDTGAAPEKGALTWVNANDGTIDNGASFGGVVADTNSLVGANAHDMIGHANFNGPVQQIDFTQNGGYVVRSPEWNSQTGAVTWVQASTGLISNTGSVGAVVDGTNSFTGSSPGDRVGEFFYRLGNGNYLIGSPSWDGDRGAITAFEGGTGFILNTSNHAEAVDVDNSLVGAFNDDRVGDFIASGYPIQTFDSGTGQSYYVVMTRNWDLGRGAVTFLGQLEANGFINGPVLTGEVDVANSLVGSNVGDMTNATLRQLASGAYLIDAQNWNSGTGAVTWVDGTSGIPTGGSSAGGVIGAGNSMVGSAPGDGIRFLAYLCPSSGCQYDPDTQDGSYAVGSASWNNDRGAIRILQMNQGGVGVFNAGNSMIGASAGDRIGSGGIINISNSNDTFFAIFSPDWDGGRGAVAFDYIPGVYTGTNVTSTSIHGSNAGDHVGIGGYRDLFFDDRIVIFSPDWNGGRGAITFGDYINGFSARGAVGTANSLTGGIAGDRVGDIASGFNRLTDGTVLVTTYGARDPFAPASQVGAVTWYDPVNLVTLDGANALNSVNSLYSTGSLAGFTTFPGIVIPTSNAQFYALAPAGLRSGIGASGRLILFAVGSGVPPGPTTDLLFSDNPGDEVTLNAASIAQALASGNLVLEANTDIIQRAGADITVVAGGSGGELALRAGRSIQINAGITSDNGNITLIANSNDADINFRDAGAGGITMGSAGYLDAGSGNITLTVESLGIAGSIGSATAPIRVQAAGVTASTQGGNIYLEQMTGALFTSAYTLSSAASGATFSLKAADDNLIVDSDLAYGGNNLVLTSTANDIVVQGARQMAFETARLTTAAGRLVQVDGVGNALTATGTTLTIDRTLQVSGNATATLDAATSAAAIDLNGGTIDGSGAIQTADLILSGAILDGSGSITVSNSFTWASGSVNNAFQDIDITHRTGDLTLNNSLQATDHLNIHVTNGALVVEEQSLSSGGAMNLSATSGITLEDASVTAGGNQVISTGGSLQIFSSTVASDGAQTLYGGAGILISNADLNPIGNQTISSGGAVQIFDSDVATNGLLQIAASSLLVQSDAGSAWVNGQSGLRVTTSGDVRILAGTDSVYMGSSDGLCTMNVGGTLELAGGTGSGASAILYGDPDIGTAATPLTIGNAIVFRSGSNEGTDAVIHAGAIDTIHVFFPTLSSGGYTVNGVAATSLGGSGFYAFGDPAVLNSNLFITYGAPRSVSYVDGVIGGADRLLSTLYPRVRVGLDDPDNDLPQCR